MPCISSCGWCREGFDPRASTPLTFRLVSRASHRQPLASALSSPLSTGGRGLARGSPSRPLCSASCALAVALVSYGGQGSTSGGEGEMASSTSELHRTERGPRQRYSLSQRLRANLYGRLPQFQQALAALGFFALVILFDLINLR